MGCELARADFDSVPDMTTALQVRISYFVYTVAGEANFEAHL
jgi:hypothetical protein